VGYQAAGKLVAGDPADAAGDVVSQGVDTLNLGDGCNVPLGEPLPSPEERARQVGLGRFQVMALLQAARYYIVHGDLEKAKSFGLNRAIFYAWAKHYGPRGARYAASIEALRRAARARRTRCPEGMEEVLGECVSRSKRGWFEIGGQEQLPRDFDREVKRRIEAVARFEDVWRAAVEYVSSFPRWVLESQHHFYKLVYEPVRDRFFADVLKGEAPKPPRQILERLEALRELEKKTRTLDEFT
jgi:hypothetical protein